MGVKCLDGYYPFFKHPDGDVTIACTVEQIRALHEAETPLEKARATFAFTKTQLRKLYPGSRWTHCENILRLARKLSLQGHDGSEDFCDKCIVIRALRGAKFNFCMRVVSKDNPKEQLAIAQSVLMFG